MIRAFVVGRNIETLYRSYRTYKFLYFLSSGKDRKSRDNSTISEIFCQIRKNYYHEALISLLPSGKIYIRWWVNESPAEGYVDGSTNKNGV